MFVLLDHAGVDPALTCIAGAYEFAGSVGVNDLGKGNGGTSATPSTAAKTTAFAPEIIFGAIAPFNVGGTTQRIAQNQKPHHTGTSSRTTTY